MATLTANVHVVGAGAVLAAFRRLPADADRELRETSMELSRTLAGRVAAGARSDSRQSALMAPTVRAGRDRVPMIVAGGATRVGSRRVPAFKILFGSEHGARSLHQFRPHQGAGSYWLFSTVEANEAEIGSAWRRAAGDIVEAFGRGA